MMEMGSQKVEWVKGLNDHFYHGIATGRVGDPAGVGGRRIAWFHLVAGIRRDSNHEILRYHETVAKEDGCRVLILTLFCGENEFDACRRSISSQRGVSCEHRVYENLSKAEAHTRLYETIAAESDNFELFLKLDADMAFTDSNSLSRIAGIFRRIQDLDHLVLGVSDWYTDTEIIGVHTFSRRARWLPNPSGLFTDPDPVFPGRKVVVPSPRPQFVRHGFDPSPFQAFYFGVHRAMKACQPGLGWRQKRPFGARTNWWTLVRVWHHYWRDRDPRLGLALLGADLVLCGDLPPSAVNRQDAALLAAFQATERLSAGEVWSRIQPGWSTRMTRQTRWAMAMGLPMSSMVVGRTIRDAVISPVRWVRQNRRERIIEL